MASPDRSTNAGDSVDQKYALRKGSHRSEHEIRVM